MPQLSAIHIYPVKSLGAITLQSARVEARGLRHDRRFLLVNPNGDFLTQRELPQMARLQTRILGEELEIENANGTTLQVPLSSSGARLPVQIWGDSVEAVAVGQAADAWFSEALKTRCRLVWMPDDSERRIDQNYARAGEITSFADGFPALLTSESSLADLNQRLDAPVRANRFRANLEVAGAAPWEEDGWKRFRIGEVEWENLKPCARCVITTIDPQLGARDGLEPLRTLATFRKRAGGVMFGSNLVARSFGRVQVGDRVEVLERF